MIDKNRPTPVGRVVATELKPATPHQFHFWTANETPIGIGAIVRVEASERGALGVGRVVYGVVTDGFAYSDLATPLHDVVGAEGDPARAAEAPTVRQEIRLWTAAVLRQIPEEPLQPVPLGQVHVAGDADGAQALRVDAYVGGAPPTPIPIGPYTAGELDAEDRRRYARLDIEPRPFERVRYFAPFKADGVNLNTLRTHPDLVGDVDALVWGLQEVLDFAEVLLNRDDIDAKADAFIDFLADRVLNREFDDGFGGTHRVTTFADLNALFRAIFDGLEATGRSDMWRTHHLATMRKVRNRLANISTRCKGLVTDDGPSNDLPWGELQDRTVYVVDVANVDPLGQDLVFARVVSKLREHLERRDLGVDAVVVFVDELNKYAPADGPETYVKKMLLDISERGRYLGLVLFGAEQFRSQGHRRIVGNAGTLVYGRMDMDELATPGYQGLSPATKIKLATLPIGELMVRHPHFTQPIFLRLPRPAPLRCRDGVERFPPAADLPFADAVVRQLLRLDRRIRPNAVHDLIVDRAPDDVRRALAATRRARPEDPLAFFRRALGARVAAAEPAGRAREAVPPPHPPSDEPY